MRRVARHAFTVLAAISALLCIAVCVLWVRSYVVADTLRFQITQPDRFRDDLLGSSRVRVWLYGSRVFAQVPGEKPSVLRVAPDGLSWRTTPRPPESPPLEPRGPIATALGVDYGAADREIGDRR